MVALTTLQDFVLDFSADHHTSELPKAEDTVGGECCQAARRQAQGHGSKTQGSNGGFHGAIQHLDGL